MGKGGGKTQTVKQDTAPWKAQQPFLEFGFNEARDIYNSGAPQYFPGETIAGIDPAQNAALDWTEQRAMAGNPLLPQAQNLAYSTLGGDFLGAGNPYFSAMSDRIGNEVTKNVNSTFGAAGRFGSGAHANALASGLSDTIGQLAYQNYGDERANMMNTMQFAPALAEADYADIGRLGQAGDARRGLEQGLIDDDVARFNFEQNAPWERLGNYMGLVSGGYGSSGTTVQPTQRGSLGAGLLGGGLAGAGIASALGMSNPWTAALALGGGLLGGLGR